MAKVSSRQKSASKSKVPESAFQFPLGRTNVIIILIGVALIIIGYIFMALPDNPDDFLTLTLAPVILVFSYCVVIPVGLLYKEKSRK